VSAFRKKRPVTVRRVFYPRILHLEVDHLGWTHLENRRYRLTRGVSRVTLG